MGRVGIMHAMAGVTAQRTVTTNIANAPLRLTRIVYRVPALKWIFSSYNQKISDQNHSMNVVCIPLMFMNLVSRSTRGL
jgi:hypothetical protein